MHPLCGQRVITASGITGTVTRVVCSMFGQLALLDSTGEKEAYAIATLQVVKTRN